MPNLIQKAWNFLHYRLIAAPRGGGKPVPASALDREYSSGNWDHFFGPDELARHEILVELVHAAHPRPRLLDIGCGSGRFASMLNPTRLAGYQGVDLSNEGLARARALGLPHGNFHQGNFEEWTPLDRYDVITFNECIGYASSPARTAVRFARSLRPGGVVIVSHFRFGNHSAVWRSLGKHFTFVTERTATNAKGQIWDLKVLAPRSGSAQ